jgi:phosphoglycerol transferase MdoB-like AlkP superfamily enzyme
VSAATVLALGLGLFLGIRGRLGTFPLNEQDLAVAPEPFVNALVPNGSYALYTAYRQRESISIGSDPLAGLHALGFRAPSDAAAVLGLTPAGAPDDAVAAALWTTTRENRTAAAHPPHVVVVLMESWGADLLSYHSARNDLLGRLAPHLDAGLLFRRFLTSHNGTHPVLETLLLSTPITPLTYSAYGHIEYEQAAVRPFRAAGYRTVFATAGSGGWRAVARVLPQQGFDEVRDMADVLEAVPGARVGTWGVYDHELFTWAEQRLREADRSGKPLLLVLLTATNHPPHAVPPEYRLGPLDPGVVEGRDLGDPALRRPILQTYQYSSDALGGFLDAVRDAGLADRTIVAATGDHNVRSFFEYPATNDLVRRDAVPLFLAVPPPYLEGRSADVSRWASHRDIFPTLAGLALSRARIFRSGEDLLEPPRRVTRALTHWGTLVSEMGAIDRILSPPGASGSGIFAPSAYFRWGPDGALVECSEAACRGPLEAVQREERAQCGLLDWTVRRQAIRGVTAPRPPR